jgi:DNA-binding phage protein
MALTKLFRETVYNRAQRDGAFRKALLTEAVNAYLSGDEITGKSVLRDVINETIGFEQLAADLQKPAKSLHRMLGPGGNPNTANFFAILQVLQKRAGVRLTVKWSSVAARPARHPRKG